MFRPPQPPVIEPANALRYTGGPLRPKSKDGSMSGG